MGKFDGILICSDFDGTLAHEAKISDVNRDAVRYFQSEGGVFVPVSGRPYHFFKLYEDVLKPSRYIVGLNGAEIYDCVEQKMAYRDALDKPSALKLVYDILYNFPEMLRVYIHDAEGGQMVSLQNWADTEKLDGDIYKMVFIVDTENSDRMADTLASYVPENYLIERSWINGIELLARHNTKGESVKRLRGLFGERAKKTVAVGDYENDITMLREADIGYAVKGSGLKVRMAADRMTVSVTENAIAYVIEDIENELRTAPGSFWHEVIRPI